MTRPLVVNLGLPRTGTSSLREAMTMLGWSAQINPYDRARLELLFAGRAREAIDRDLAAGHTFLSEPYYAFAGAVLEALRPGEIPLVTLRSGEAWMGSMGRRAAKATYTPVPPWLHPFTPFTAEQQMLLWLWRGRDPSGGAAQKAWERATALADEGRARPLLLCDQPETAWRQLYAALQADGSQPMPPIPFPHANAS